MSETKFLRQVRRATAALVVAAVATSGVMDRPHSGTSSESKKTNNQTILTPTPTETEPPFRQNELGGVKVYYDQDGFPTSYILSDETYQFSSDQIEKMKAEAKIARDKNEPALLVNIPEEYRLPPVESWQVSPDRPLIDKQLPDVLSERDLREYGVTEIIQGKETNLFIRREAFEPGGILNDLLRAQSLKKPVKLRIVLVDGPFVSNDYMNDDKYKDVASLVPSRTWGVDDFLL